MIDLINGGTPTTASQLLNWKYANTVVERNGQRNVYHVYKDGYMRQTSYTPEIIGNAINLKIIYKGAINIDVSIAGTDGTYKLDTRCPNKALLTTYSISLIPDIDCKDAVFNINITTPSDGYIAYISMLCDVASASIDTDDFVSSTDYKKFIENAILYGPDDEKPMLR